MDSILDFKASISALTLYSNVKDDVLIKKFLSILSHIKNNDGIELLIEDWALMTNCLYNKNYQGDWAKYICDLIYFDKNYFSLEVAKGNYDALNENIKKSASSDIDTLTALANVKCSDFKELLYSRYPYDKDMIDSLPEFDTIFMSLTLNDFLKSYLQDGVGIFAKHRSFKFTNDCNIEPVENFDTVSLADLKRYKMQQNVVIENTLGFLRDKTYNNVLLYGDRGTGKSSTVKAILNEYYMEGLRIIQVYKENLVHLDLLMRAISEIPLKFIVFIDDLTFNDSDDNFGALKAVLEGSLAKQPSNMAIYATTNRRHLVRESFSAREGNEVHLADTIDETVSLSDRFGITVTFTFPNKDNFLQIVKEIAQDRGLDVPDETLFSEAERFALSKGNRSPRLARQFVNYLQARLELDLPIQ